MELIDTHCHIHSKDYPLDTKDVIQDAAKDKIVKMIAVGLDVEDSKLAIKLAKNNKVIWASIGIHPHEAKHFSSNKTELNEFSSLALQKKVIAVGECGLDYYYDRSDKFSQKELLEFQLQVASDNNLPLIFHVREAFDDFWQILDNFKNIKGVIHSFTADNEALEQTLKRNLLIGLNGIVTFTKNSNQIEVIKKAPIESIILETDAPYLTPVPFRGTICQPKHVLYTAEFLAELRNETLDNFAKSTTGNAIKLFNLKDLDA